MAEPITPNRSLIAPNTGDLTGAWGTSALNPNWQTIDALFGGVTTISLSGATTLALTVPATTGVWPGFLSQSVNSLIYFTGAQTGNAVIQFTLPGFYIIHNQCTGTSYVQLAPAAGTGNAIGAPPGKKCHVFFDGTSIDYVNMPDPGTAHDLHTNTTAFPPWMLACTIPPYLVKDGSTYSVATFPALAQLLGSTYGGNGITTFGLPDERARARIAVDTVQPASGATSARITLAIAGFTGSLLGAAGGDQNIGNHSHPFTSATQTVNTNQGGVPFNCTNNTVNNGSQVFGPQSNGVSYGQLSITFAASGTTNVSGGGVGANMPPSIVSFLPLVKT